MQKNRYMCKAFAVLSAAAALVVASCCLGLSQARYENYAQWQGVYTPQQIQLHSDQLASGGQIVLLSDWCVESKSSRMKGITIRANTGTVSGHIRCSVDRSEYLTVSTDRTALTADTIGVQTQLTMTPTEAALSLTEEVTATIHVAFFPEGAAEPALWADYQVELLPYEKTQTENEETPAAETVPAVLPVSGPESFAWTELLAVQTVTPPMADTLVFRMDGGNFPEGTRYIHNGTKFLLGDDMQIEIAVQGQQRQDLVLDFSLLPRQNDTLTMQAQILHQQAVTAAGEYTVETTREALRTDLSEVDLILKENTQLKIPLCRDTSGLVWRLEMLTETEAGIAYTQSNEQFYLVVTISEETDDAGTQKCITISNANGRAPAGTYRLTLERMQEEQIISSTKMQFFVCY